MVVEVDEFGGAEGAPESGPRRLGRRGALEERAAEVGYLGAEAGERGLEFAPVVVAVAVAPAQVVVVVAQVAVLELGGGPLLRRLRRHLAVARGGAPAFVR